MQWRLVEYLHNKSAPESSNTVLSYVFHLHLKTLAILQITHKSLKQCAHLLLLSSRPPEGSRPSLSTWWAPIQRTAQREVFNLLPHSLVLCALPVLQVTLPHAVFSMKFTNWQKYSLRPKDIFIFGLIASCKRVWFCRFWRWPGIKTARELPCYHILLGERLAEKPPALALAPCTARISYHPVAWNSQPCGTWHLFQSMLCFSPWIQDFILSTIPIWLKLCSCWKFFFSQFQVFPQSQTLRNPQLLPYLNTGLIRP